MPVLNRLRGHEGGGGVDSPLRARVHCCFQFALDSLLDAEWMALLRALWDTASSPFSARHARLEDFVGTPSLNAASSTAALHRAVRSLSTEDYPGRSFDRRDLPSTADLLCGRPFGRTCQGRMRAAAGLALLARGGSSVQWVSGTLHWSGIPGVPRSCLTYPRNQSFKRRVVETLVGVYARD